MSDMPGQRGGPVLRDPLLDGEFRRTGSVRLPRTISEHKLEALDAFFERSRSYYAGTGYCSTLAINGAPAHRREAHLFFRTIVDELIERTLHDYVQFYGGFGIKHPTGDAAVLDIHQDITMVPYDAPRTGVTLWLPLCDTDSRNGCLQVWDGSHLINRRPRATGAPFAYGVQASMIESELLREVPMTRGEMVIMDQALIHRSGPNHSEKIRTAVMGMFRPRETGLVYYHRIVNDSGVDLEEFRVDDLFYTKHQLGRRPDDAAVRRVLPEEFNAFPSMMEQAI